MKKFLFKLLVLATVSTGITSEVYLLESLKTAPTVNAVGSNHQATPEHSAVLKPYPANRPMMNEDKRPDDSTNPDKPPCRTDADDQERGTADDALPDDTDPTTIAIPTKMKTRRAQFYRGVSIYQWVYLF